MNRNRKLRLRTGVIGAATAALVGSTLALAAIPATEAAVVPADTTQAPELLTATLASNNEVGTKQEATFCFDQPIVSKLDTRLYIHTYDAGRYLRATGSTLAVDTKCLIVQFPTNFDLNSQASLAEVDEGGVTASNSEVNYYTSVPITGSSLAPRAGQTTAPDLIAATPQATNTDVQFTFDQAFDRTRVLNNLATTAGEFFVADDAGAVLTGTTVVGNPSNDNTKITIRFSGNATNKSRYFYKPSPPSASTPTVIAPAQSGNLRLGIKANMPASNLEFQNFTAAPDGVVNLTDSERPVLQSVTPGANGLWKFNYNKSVHGTTFTFGEFKAVFDIGDVETAASASITADPKVVQVTFPADGKVAREPDAVVKVISGLGAVRTVNNDAVLALPSQVNRDAAPMTPGRTSGPDLLSMTLDKNNFNAIYTFDEQVANESFFGAGSAVAIAKPSAATNAFKLIGGNGKGTGQQNTPIAAGTQVTVNYPDVFSNARAVSIGFSGVTDRLGNPNVSSAVAGSSSTPTGPTAAPDSVSVNVGQSALVNVLANDTTAAAPTVSLPFTFPAGINATLEGTSVRVSVSPGYTGPVNTSISYRVTDTNGSADGNIAITVPDAPKPGPTPAECNTAKANAAAAATAATTAKAKLKKAKAKAKKAKGAKKAKLKKKVKKLKKASKSANSALAAAQAKTAGC